MEHTAVGVLLALAASGTSVYAATNEELQKQIELLQETVEALKQQVESQNAALPESVAAMQDIEGVRADLENFKFDESRLRERNTVKSIRNSTLFGVVQVRGQAQTESIQASSDSKNSFDIPTALLGLRGNLYRDYVDGKNLDYQFSFTYGKRSTESTARSDFSLADAFLRYNFFSTNGGPEIPKLNITFGQQRLPFGLEAQAPEDLRPTINLSQASIRSGLFNRQVGAVVRGDFMPYVDYSANYRAPLLEYAFGVVNGNVSNQLDDNNSKGILARAAFTLPVDYASWLRELKIGGSIYKNYKNLRLADGSTKNNVTNDRYGVDVFYNHAPFGFTYEYIHGRDDFQVGNSNQIKEAKSEGHTVTLFYTFGDQFYNSIKSVAKFDDWHPKSIQPFFRYDYFNPNDSNETLGGNRGNGDDTVTTYTLGLNWFFAQTTKFQLELSHRDFETETTLLGAERKDDFALLAQFQYTF
ncbi:MAG: DUF3138 domain-containing protein [Methyloprofundus sp.]|nr:DUF3138 domain-containing protein [Methyloprofundus sp.]